MLELLNEPAYVRFIGDRGVRTVEAAREYVRRGPIDSYARYGHGLYLTELKTNGTPIGMCGLLKREVLADPDIGFAFLPQFWSKGYAFEAASAVMQYASQALRLTRILAVVSPGNDRSIKLLAKLGMIYERTMRWPDSDEDVQLFASSSAQTRVRV